MTYEEKCKYCEGDCPNDEENSCDGYSGDIDQLYADDNMVEIDKWKKS
jgi:hypothetical protein